MGLDGLVPSRSPSRGGSGLSGLEVCQLELRVKLFMLVGKLEIALDPEWEDRMTPAWPLGPRGLRLVLKQRGVLDVN